MKKISAAIGVGIAILMLAGCGNKAASSKDSSSSKVSSSKKATSKKSSSTKKKRASSSSSSARAESSSSTSSSAVATSSSASSKAASASASNTRGKQLSFADLRNNPDAIHIYWQVEAAYGMAKLSDWQHLKNATSSNVMNVEYAPRLNLDADAAVKNGFAACAFFLASEGDGDVFKAQKIPFAYSAGTTESNTVFHFGYLTNNGWMLKYHEVQALPVNSVLQVVNAQGGQAALDRIQYTNILGV